MSARRLSVRKIKEILRLWLLSWSIRKISESVHTARSTISEYIHYAKERQISWEQIKDLDDEQVYRLVIPPRPPGPSRAERKPLPDWKEVHEDLANHKNLTVTQCWEEYRANHPDGYGLSQYHHHYSCWKRKLSVVMRQTHRPGEKLFVDFCDGPKIIDESGKEITTQLFVAVWGASNYTFVRAVESQQLRHWLDCHAAAFEFFGCVPQITVPDNLKSGIHRACRFEPELNPSYQDLAIHYGTAVIPARPYKPRDKAKVEAGVLLAERWILSALRKRTFQTVGDLNAAMFDLLEKLNNKEMKMLGQSRRQRFDLLDRPAALSLPLYPYEFAAWRKMTLGLDYHILAEKHYYSVPFQLVGELIDVRITSRIVEVFYKGARVASHVRSDEIGGRTTLLEHMPRSHREQAGLNLEVLTSWAERTGPATVQLLKQILIHHNHSASAFGAFKGIYYLGNKYGKERIEKAAARAVAYGSCSYRGIKNILYSNLDQQPLLTKEGCQQTLPFHENIRGSQYYKGVPVYVE